MACMQRPGRERTERHVSHRLAVALTIRHECVATDVLCSIRNGRSGAEDGNGKECTGMREWEGDTNETETQTDRLLIMQN